MGCSFSSIIFFCFLLFCFPLYQLSPNRLNIPANNARLPKQTPTISIIDAWILFYFTVVPALAYTRIVDVYSVIIRIMMCHIGNDGGYCVLHLFPFTPFSL